MVIFQSPGQVGGGGGRGVSAAATAAAAGLVVGAFVVPPVGNTGGRFTPGCLTVRPDWLNVTFPEGSKELVAAVVSEFLGEPVDREWGRHTYALMTEWATGACLCWSPGRHEALLSMNGDSFDFVPLDELLPMFKRLEEIGVKCSRLDVAVDDLSRSLFDLDQAALAAASGNFTGYKVAQVLRPVARVAGRMEATGYSVTFGKRGKEGSGRQVQLYDKALESGGEINSIRLELRTFKERADLLFQLLCSAGDVGAFVTKMGNAIGGAIDFRDRSSGDPNLDRLPRLAWWQNVVDCLGELSLRVARPLPPLQSSLRHLARTWSPTLAVARAVANSQGLDFIELIEQLIDQADGRADFRRFGRRDLAVDFDAAFDLS